MEASVKKESMAGKMNNETCKTRTSYTIEKDEMQVFAPSKITLQCRGGVRRGRRASPVRKF